MPQKVPRSCAVDLVCNIFQSLEVAVSGWCTRWRQFRKLHQNYCIFSIFLCYLYVVVVTLIMSVITAEALEAILYKKLAPLNQKIEDVCILKFIFVCVCVCV